MKQILIKSGNREPEWFNLDDIPYKSYSILGFRNWKYHTVINYKNQIVNLDKMRMKVS